MPAFAEAVAPSPADFAAAAFAARGFDPSALDPEALDPEALDPDALAAEALAPEALAAAPAPADPAPAPPPDARAQRLKQFKRDQVVVDYLNRGVSVSEIAARIGVGEKRARAIVREVLDRRMPAPPREFLAIQTSRLNEALLVAFSAMGGDAMTALRGVDRVVKVVRELDRYHGFVPGRARPRRWDAQAPDDFEGYDDAPAESLHRAPATARFGASFAAAMTCRAEFAVAGLEAYPPSRGGYEHGPRPEEPAKQASRRTCAPVSVLRDASPCGDAPQDEVGEVAILGSDARPEIPAEAPEKIESAPGFGATWRAGVRDAEAAAAATPPERDDLEARPRGHDSGPAPAAAESGERPEISPQRVENPHSAPGFFETRRPPADRPAVAVPTPSPASAAALRDRPEDPLQALEKLESAPGFMAALTAPAGGKRLSAAVPSPGAAARAQAYAARLAAARREMKPFTLSLHEAEIGAPSGGNPGARAASAAPVVTRP